MLKMLSINLNEIKTKEEIAKIILIKMENNGITKSEVIAGTHLSKTAVDSVLCKGNTNRDYMLSSLLKVLNFLKIKIFLGKNEDLKAKVLSLF
jgi:predicted XRE-type DNA-binding protein